MNGAQSTQFGLSIWLEVNAQLYRGSVCEAKYSTVLTPGPLCGPNKKEIGHPFSGVYIFPI